MTTLGSQQRREPEQLAENAQQRMARLEREAALLDVAYADIAAGRVLKGDALGTWLDDWAKGRDVPLPDRASPTA